MLLHHELVREFLIGGRLIKRLFHVIVDQVIVIKVFGLHHCSKGVL
jgi:hypothetical protein